MPPVRSAQKRDSLGKAVRASSRARAQEAGAASLKEMRRLSVASAGSAARLRDAVLAGGR